MFDRIFKVLFSTKLMAIILLIIGLALAKGTFIESDYSTAVAQRVIYSALWFEILIFIFAINLVANIYKYKLYRREKWSVFFFHISFIVIIIGAAITRYYGYEGGMRIREGESGNKITSTEVYFDFKVDDKKLQYTFQKEILPNVNIDDIIVLNDYFDHDFEFGGKEIHLAYNQFIPNSIDTIAPDPNGTDILEIVTVGHDGRESVYIQDGSTEFIGPYAVSFNDDKFSDAIKLTKTDSGLVVLSPYDMNYMLMADQSKGVLVRDSLQSFSDKRLYSIGETQLVYKDLHEKSTLKKITSSVPKSGIDAIVIEIESGGEKRKVYLFGGKGYVTNKTRFSLNELDYTMSYGSQHITLPFSLQLNDFDLERYPGSMSPSSYSSKVTVIDERDGSSFDHHIFMNNVLDYDGYRFFQSSFDKDELGTILSVNHDMLGTLVTYFGYALMILGMIFTFITPKTRFASLRKKLVKKSKKKARLLGVLVFLIFTNSSFAQENLVAPALEAPLLEQKTEDYFAIVPVEQAAKFGRLIVQDKSGRMKPVQSLASELLRKLTRKSKWKGYTPNQIFVGILQNPHHWLNEKMILVDHPKLAKELGAVDNYVAFNSFFDNDFVYLLSDKIQNTIRKADKDRNKYDKEIIKVDERVNILYLLSQGSMLSIFPMPNDDNNKWYSMTDWEKFDDQAGGFVKSILPMYLGVLTEGIAKNDFALTDTTLNYIVAYQNKFGSAVIPPESKINLEISYNKMKIFNHAFESYFVLSLLLIFLLFFDLFKSRKLVKRLITITSILIFIVFLYHMAGLGIRWYISGHAPWSNAYEALTYIAWVTVLAGFIFGRQSKFALASATLMASFTLLVAMLNWLDPDIGTLAPVLKSYWLTIHVAIMSGSYGFLGLSAIIGIIIMTLYLLLNKNNSKLIYSKINELTHISELTMTVGVFMAAIGTFLGGIWANESWGRYWGWDPKETWALIIVIVYAIILHLRIIPKANSKFTFNALGILSYSSVLMTYFGVNYFLVGLHSYAGGSAPVIPDWVFYSSVSLVLFIILAWFNYRKHKNIKKEKKAGLE